MVMDHSDSQRGNPHRQSLKLAARVLLYALSQVKEYNFYFTSVV